ncbi:MAG: hypothetical protein ACTS3R_07130 [Inquilinaceae bacterium]
MLTFEDCLALAELSEEEVDAIAEHEHVPEIVALELGHYLIRTPSGEVHVRRIIEDDINAARARRDFVHVAKLKLVLKHYLDHHAAARRKA